MTVKRFILSFVFLYIGLVVTAGNRVEIFTPRIPVVTGREYGIVTEICIESDGRADTLDRIDLAVTDLDPALLVIATKKHMRFVANAAITKGFVGLIMNNFRMKTKISRAFLNQLCCF